ncbi:DEAD/DEAH box helicase [Paenibacillus glycanilyticus]|uniref:DEAD/DEAH box helicase n=1 Tax=Paenibacillus glycanilyticus TaxID=126569 RepID=UPI0020408CC4|nr:DEAD/DEAH box helicase [Paenibacillus glycanilyticus]MCM3629026.1 DEAD/DEAH box helicase [Paenibacillus glycanilyticus]
MKSFIGARTLLVDGYWKQGDQAENNGLLLMAADRAESPARLKQVLFAWHQASWYGAEIEEVDADGGKALRLPPLIAVDYLSSPQHVRLLQVEWTARLQGLMNMAGMLREALLEGWFQPDWSGWSEHRRAWRLEIPAEKNEFAAEWERQIRETGITGADQWLSEAVEEILAQNDQAAAAWRKIAAAAGGESVLLHKAADEEDWLIALGLHKDTMPFKVALQLAEPVEGASWQLRPALQDRNGGPWIPVAAVKGQWRALFEQDGPLPEDWAPHLETRLAKEHSKWLAVLPDWRDEAEPEKLRRQLTDNDAWFFMEKASLKLLEAGCPVLLPGWWEAVRSRRLRLKAKMKSSVGSDAQPMFGLDQIVQFDWKMALGNIDLSESEFMRLAEENRRLMNIGGEWVHLDPQDVAQIRDWMKRVGKRTGLSFRDVMEMHLLGGAVMEDGEDASIALRAEVELNDHLSRWLEQLQHTAEIPMAEIPSSFLGSLRPYQLQGVSWLLFLRKFGLGGVLADDMGLGKTIQFMAYLSYVKAHGDKSRGPSLLICPTSVIGNWEKELEKFAPTLQAYLHYGPKREKGEALREAIKDADIVITSYSLAQIDEEELNQIQWDALCLDEAQNIKNVYTKQSAAIRGLPANHRIALTGTPMENRLTELWSIYDFINPGYLGSMGEFRKAIVLPIEKNRDEQVISGLQRWVKPFMLRRVKKDPAIQLSLPDKNEAKTYLTLTTEQGAIYENIVADLLEKLDKLGPMQRRGIILASLTRLKQLCDHPAMLSDERELAQWDDTRSNKVARLLEMVEEIASEGERCLIFTQFVDMGEQLKKLLEERLELPVPYLHGGVPKAKRDEMIDKFQNPEEPCCAFVLSLKAGGTGLNLTAANHVFHFDRWWNPAVENQATDRAFRIGQTKKVQVHKFITLGTLEEKIDEMIDRKQQLNEQVVGQSEQWITELSTDELKELFALRKNWLKG